LGVHYFFGLALLAGLARFIPYVGPFVAWTSYGLVAFFQGSTIFGLSPVAYVALVVGCAWLTDVVMDNFVVPRLMSNALRVHPAAVMVSALVAFNLLGVIGMVLAAPVLATVKLFLEYLLAKMFDQDPWANLDTMPAAISPSLPPIVPTLQSRYTQLRATFAQLRAKVFKTRMRAPESRENNSQ
jgi:putative heme transporter